MQNCSEDVNPRRPSVVLAFFLNFAIIFLVRSILDGLMEKVLEIGDNLEVLMSDERVAVLCQEIDEWAAQKAKEDSMEVSLKIAPFAPLNSDVEVSFQRTGTLNYFDVKPSVLGMHVFLP